MQRASLLVFGFLAVGVALLLTGDVSESKVASSRNVPLRQPASFGSAAKPLPQVPQQKVIESYGKLPLSFEPCFEANCGDSGGAARFLSRGPGYTLFLTATEAVLVLRKPLGPGDRSQEPVETQSEPRPQGSGGANPSPDRKGRSNPQIAQITPIVIPETARSSSSVKSAKSADETSVLRMKLVGANPAPRIIGLEPLPGKSNPQQLEFDFVVAPGADSKAIRLAFDGADKLEVDTEGDLVAQIAGEEVRLRKPRVYQQVDGGHREVSSNYLLGRRKESTFEVAAYDTTS
jgi:hypothetical protein